MATIRREGEMNLRDLYKFYISEGGILSYNKYKEIVESFMKELVLKIIKTGEGIILPYHCGHLQIIQLERKYSIKENGNIRGAVDWGESNKLKQQIIDSGEIPLVNVKDEDGNIIETNGGKPWMCYHTSRTYFSWAWTSDIRMKNCLQYTYDTTDTNSKILSKNITDNSHLIYKLRKRNGTNKDYLRRTLVAAGAIKI